MLAFHHLLIFPSENIVILCFQSHGVLLTNYKESVCHATASDQVLQPPASKQGVQIGARNQASYSEK